MLLRLIREPSSGGRTFGVLFVNGHFFCYTLEDAIREPELAPAADLEEWVRSWKIPHETAIPQGRYQVGLTRSQRFQMVLPELLKVPGFSGIRIHAGNTEKDTEGCILLGHTRAEDKVLESRLALTWLMQRLTAVAHEAIIIDIENPRPEDVLQSKVEAA